MRFIWNHFLDSYSTGLTASTEATNFDASKVLDPLLFKVYRSTSLSDQYLLFDSGAVDGFTFDSVFISNHNLQNTSVIKFQMNATDSWGSPTLNETLTWRESHIVKFFASTSARYCRFYFDDDSNPDGYISVGRVSASQYLQFSPSSEATFNVENVRNDIVNITPSANVYGYLGSAYRKFSYNFPPSDYTMIAKIRTMYAAVGKVIPILAMNFDTRYTEFNPCYCVITNDINEEWTGNKAKYSLVLQEVGGYN